MLFGAYFKSNVTSNQVTPVFVTIFTAPENKTKNNGIKETVQPV